PHRHHGVRRPAARGPGSPGPAAPGRRGDSQGGGPRRRADPPAARLQPPAGTAAAGAGSERARERARENATPPARRGCEAGDRAGPDAGPRPGRGRPGRAGDHEPRRQRARRDAHGGPAHDRDGGRRVRRRLRGGALPRPAGQVRDARRQRHRHGHGPRDPGPPVRAVLHHQGKGQGHRPRARHGVRHREAERRIHLGVQLARRGNHVQDLSPARRRGGRAGERPRRARSRAPRQRDRARRRRRSAGARRGPPRPGALRLPRARGRERGSRPGRRAALLGPHPRAPHGRHHAGTLGAGSGGPPRGAATRDARHLHVGLHRRRHHPPRRARARVRVRAEALHPGRPGAHRARRAGRHHRAAEARLIGTGLSLERRIQIGFGIAVAIIVAVGAAALRSTEATVSSAQWVAHTLQVRAELEAGFADLIEAETGVRGYVITGDTTYLAPYHSARATLNSRLAGLRALTADNPAQQRRLDSLDTLVATRLERFQWTIETRRTGGPAAAARAVSGGRGKELIRLVHDVITQMEEDEGRLLAQRSVTLQAKARLARLAAWTGALVALALAGLASVLVGREMAGRRVAEERLRLLVGSVRDYAIYMVDPAGYVKSWNAGAERIKGYAPPEILGQHFARFFTPEDVAAGRPAAVLHAAATEGRYEEENWRLRKDGSRFWADVVITAVRDERGALLGFAKVTRDLTERKRAEQALRASEERFRILAVTANDA